MYIDESWETYISANHEQAHSSMESWEGTAILDSYLEIDIYIYILRLDFFSDMMLPITSE